MKFFRKRLSVFLFATSVLCQGRDLNSPITEILPRDTRACVLFGSAHYIPATTPAQQVAIERILANGGSADVFRVELASGDFVIRKYLSVRGQGAKFSSEHFLHEDAIYKHLAESGYQQMSPYRGLWRDEKGRIFLEFAETKGVTLDTYLQGAFIRDNSAKDSLKGGLVEFEKMLTAVADLHEKSRVAHFDLKGANIRRLEDGRYQILDYASARMERAEPDALGQYFDFPGAYSEGYTAPEILARKGYGYVSDVYSLGKILELKLLPEWENHARLLGTDSKTLAKWKKSLFDSVLKKALDPDPKRRFQSVNELKNAISRWRTEFGARSWWPW